MIIEIDHPPKFKSTYGYSLPLATYVNTILQSKKEEQQNFLRQAQCFRDHFSNIPVDAADGDPNPRWNQNWFPPLDGISLYSIIGTFHPRHYMEIGSGNSTKFARRAIRDHGLNTTIMSIDPKPRSEIDALCDKIFRSRLEETDLSIFSGLRAGDILFFDGSHRCFQNSDVATFFIDLIPMLNPGTIIGIHDIFWPRDYPEAWVKRYYNEQYMLAAYMLALGVNFPLLFSCAWSTANLSVEARACFSDSKYQELRAKGRGRISGGCLWFQKPHTPF